MQSTNNYSFSQVPRAEIPRSSFDRSSGYKTSFNVDELVPFFVEEYYPGDTFNLKTSGLVRLATPIFPIMDNMSLDTHYFSVPYRLLWDNWKKLMGEQASPGDSTDYLVPQVDTSGYPTGFNTGTIWDYVGLPVGVPNLSVSALPFRAIQKIYDEWYRDQNLQNSTQPATDDGPDDGAIALFNRKRGKRHDYFTSSLPWPQKGPAVELPLGTTAPTVRDGAYPGGTSIPQFTHAQDSLAYAFQVDSSDSNVAYPGTLPSNPATEDLRWGSQTGLVADLTNATAATINELRMAFQVQKLYERDARGGTRYPEMIQAHFNVSSPDARQQRSEYLGGGTAPINISPIYASADTGDGVTDGRPLGGLSAVGTASFHGHGFTKSFTEHGVIIGFLSTRADLSYQRGINRMWSRQDRLDFYFPVFAHLGEQEVLNKEIYADGTATDEETWGYQERFAELRYKPSIITGILNSNETGGTPLDAWHLAEQFFGRPALNDTFIQGSTPLKRAIAVTNQPDFIGDFFHKLTCARPMPMYGVPGNIDRF